MTAALLAVCLLFSSCDTVPKDLKIVEEWRGVDEEGNELMVPAGETKKGVYRIDLSKADFSFEEARSFYGSIFGILGWGAEIEDSVDVPGYGSIPIYGDYQYYIDLEEFLS